MQANRVVYLEPFSGISGDMMVGALLDLGFPLEGLRQQLKLLSLHGYQVSSGKCSRAGIHATKFNVELDDSEHHGGHERHHSHDHDHDHDHLDHHDHSHGHHAAHGSSHQAHHHEGHSRTFRDIREMIRSSGLSDFVKDKSVDAFFRLALAEGKIHNQPPDDVHFHEVGAVDSIVDIVGSMIAFEFFMPAHVICSPVNVGQGTIECRHGIYPVPGPAAQELLRGIPTFSNAVVGELTTPTGATLVATLAAHFGPRPMMKIEATGYGAGTREFAGSANVLRVTLGQELEDTAISADQQVAIIEATIDDMSPQVYGYFQEKALTEGALDVYATPIQMKKNRPGQLITVVCASGSLEHLVRLIFAETTTIGVRHTLAQRRTLERQVTEVETEYGILRVKVCSLDGVRMNFAPEYEDCRRIAAGQDVPLKDVIAAANRAFLEAGGLR